MSNKRENALKNLTSLYTVIVGVALSSALVSIIDPDKGLYSFTSTSVLLLLAFISTIVPFYHGALRHLDDTYLESKTNDTSGAALVFDFFLLLLHGIGFLVLSLLMTNPSHFIFVLAAVLSIDVIWGIFVHFSKHSSSESQITWSLINGLTVILIVFYIIQYEISLETVSAGIKLPAIVFLFCLLRTLADYLFSWKFYFPKEE